ncbi:MAG: GTP-binding protein [Candidatus Omnitrophota bacterium]
MKDCLNIVVTGDVDSGKSTLIGRALYDTGSLPIGKAMEINGVCRELNREFEFAYLLDSLEEERRGQLTIDTTQSFCRLKRGKGLNFIDVPGHRELLKNMLSGSSYADVAVLVLDIRCPIEEQTKRHAFILKFLGITHVIVAVNKMDSVGFKYEIFEKAKESISGLFSEISLSPEYFIPIFAKRGDNIARGSSNMPWYNGLPLIRLLSAYDKKGRGSSFRFSVQDIYNLNGKTKVALGEVMSGCVKRKEKIVVLPENKEYTIKTIRAFNKNKAMAKAPEGIGLILDEMRGIRRGQVICKADLPEVKREIRAKILCVLPFRAAEKMRFVCATQDISVSIKEVRGVWDIASLKEKSAKGPLHEFDLAEVVLAFGSPAVVERYTGSNSLGRFVLEGDTGIRAAGVIL